MSSYKTQTNNECCSGPKTNNCLAAKPSEIKKKKKPTPHLYPPSCSPNKSHPDKHIITNRVKCTISHMRPAIHIAVKILHAYLLSLSSKLFTHFLSMKLHKRYCLLLSHDCCEVAGWVQLGIYHSCCYHTFDFM
jgi:hypothetical protein